MFKVVPGRVDSRCRAGYKKNILSTRIRREERLGRALEVIRFDSYHAFGEQLEVMRSQ